jgi:hypothetical protein
MSRDVSSLALRRVGRDDGKGSVLENGLSTNGTPMASYDTSSDVIYRRGRVSRRKSHDLI